MNIKEYSFSYKSNPHFRHTKLWYSNAFQFTSYSSLWVIWHRNITHMLLPKFQPFSFDLINLKKHWTVEPWECGNDCVWYASIHQPTHPHTKNIHTVDYNESWNNVREIIRSKNVTHMTVPQNHIVLIEMITLKWSWVFLPFF